MNHRVFAVILIGFIVGAMLLSFFTIFHRTFWRVGGGYGMGPGSGFGEGSGGRFGQNADEDFAFFIKRNIIPFMVGGLSGAAISFFYYRMRRNLQRMKKMQNRLRTSERLAAVGELAAGLAHEIRNPLGSIDGAAEILSKDLPEDHPKREMAEILQKESKRLKEKLSRFLEFARPDEIILSSCNIETELQTILELLHSNPCCRDHRIGIESNLRDPLLSVDCQKLHQVFLNLGMNAFEAMPDGGELKITLREIGHNGESSIAVDFRDTGTGMSREQIEKALNPFFTTKPGGTGLGLSISQRILEEHHGGIEIDSKPGRGTTVTVIIPRELGDGPAGINS